MFIVAVRLEETIDMSTTIKFVYIRWTGPNVPFTKRGKYGVVHGSIEEHFTVSTCVWGVGCGGGWGWSCP